MIKKTSVIRNEAPSANGPAYKIPFSPNRLDRKYTAGIKKMICLVKVSTKDILGFPTD